MSPVMWALGLVLAGLAHAASMAWPLPGAEAVGLVTGEPLPGLQWLALVWLAWAVRQAASWRSAAGRAFVFAQAWLVGTFWWLFISMNTYGGLPAPMAATAVWALAAGLGLYTAVAGAVAWRWRHASPVRYAAAFASAWLLAEWARGTWFTGFPWGAAGYAQVDAMAVWAPWVGVYGMGALSAAMAAWVAAGGWRATGWGWGVAALLILPMFWVPVGHGMAKASSVFSQPAGELQVALLQGNIAQNEKFEPGRGVPLALSWYLDTTREALEALDRRGGGVVVAPETAIPLLPQDLPAEWWRQWRDQIDRSDSAVMVGLPLGDGEVGYTNSVAAWAVGQDMYRYDKHHLVPFGEFVPPMFRWFTEMMNIPLGDFNRGDLGQSAFAWRGQRLAPNVCYEDLFGEELAVSWADGASAPTVLVNVSNIAWFGDSVAIDQHRHISRLRAIELQRPMVRATNTGATAVIDHRGRVQQELARLTRGVLYARVEGRTGVTPYAWWAGRWGLWPLVLAALGVLLWMWRRPGGRA